MALKDTTNNLKKLLEEILHDLTKAAEGNKTASQRVRTNSIKFAKTAKLYRKESIAAEKGLKGKEKKAVSRKPTPKKASKPAPKKAAKSTKKSR